MPSSKANDQSLNATEVFRKEFHGYQKMAASDYLEHTLLFGSVKEYMKQQGKPLRILDLGCGDAGNLSKILADISGSVASYTGVDMSESALKTAQALLSEALGSSMPLFFHTSDMLSFLKQTLATYDIVLAAFALHHLTTEDKTEAVKEIKRILSEKDGVFIMVDPFRREDESLKAYRERAATVGETWVNMGKEQQTNFIQHMVDYDIVEPESFFNNLAQEAGFSEKDVICRGLKGLQSNVTIFKL